MDCVESKGKDPTGRAARRTHCCDLHQVEGTVLAPRGPVQGPHLISPWATLDLQHVAGGRIPNFLLLWATPSGALPDLPVNEAEKWQKAGPGRRGPHARAPTPAHLRAHSDIRSSKGTRGVVHGDSGSGPRGLREWSTGTRGVVHGDSGMDPVLHRPRPLWVGFPVASVPPTPPHLTPPTPSQANNFSRILLQGGRQESSDCNHTGSG